MRIGTTSRCVDRRSSRHRARSPRTVRGAELGNSPRSARRRFRVDAETAQGPAGQSEEHGAAEELRGDDRQEEHARKPQDQSGDQPGELSGAGMSCGDRDGDGTLRTDVADD
jgi:hypothetical protein